MPCPEMKGFKGPNPPPVNSPEEGGRQGRILCLDIGDKRIGIAVSDPLGLIAQGLPTLFRQGTKQDIESLVRIIEETNAGKVIYGIPKNMNGSLGPQAEKTEGFIRKLRVRTDYPCVAWDERLTTLRAHKTLKEAGMSRKKRTKSVDRLSAVLILQNYLDMCNSSRDKV